MSTDLVTTILRRGKPSIGQNHEEPRALAATEVTTGSGNFRLEAADIQQVLLERDDRIRELEKEAKVRTDLKWREPCYWLANSDSQEEPYCQHCYDGSKKLARLHTDNAGRYQCRVCDNIYSTHERQGRDAEALRNARRNISRGLA